MKRQVLGLICAVIVGFSATHAAAYDYPLKNPYVATIIGTPTELQAELPEKIDYELLGLKVFPDRLTPDVFWYQQEFLVYADLSEAGGAADFRDCRNRQQLLLLRHDLSPESLL